MTTLPAADERLSVKEALERFLGDYCERGAYTEITNDLYSAYWAWCERNEQPRMKRKRFPQALGELRLIESRVDCRMTAGVRLRPL